MNRPVNKTVTEWSLPKGCRRLDVDLCITRDRLPYEPLLIQDNGDGSRTYLSDVDLLFNQSRLDRMSLQALQARLDEAARSGDTGLSELRKNISDVDLQKFVKSRYIQSLSELRQWSHYLAEKYTSTAEGIKADLVAYAQAQAAKAAKATQPEPSPAPAAE